MNKKEEKQLGERVIRRDMRRVREEMEEADIKRELEVCRQWARGGMSLIELEEGLDDIA